MKFLDHFTYFAFFQCCFLLVIFAVSWRQRRRVNPYLVILNVLLLLGLVGKLGYQVWGWSRQLHGISEFAVLFFGPTVYLFVQSTLSERRLTWRDTVHYLPGVVYSLIVTFYYILPPAQIIQARVESGELFRVVRILVGVGLAVNGTYYVLSVLRFRRLQDALQAEVSYALNLSFVRNFLIAIGGCLLTWLTVYLISFGQFPQLEIQARMFIWLAVAFIVLFLSYYQMVAPEAFRFERVIQEVKYAQSGFSKTDLARLKNELEQIMEQQKPHLNARLLKSELAALLGIHAPELSRLLNEHIGMNFFEFVNYHRIQEFIRLASTPAVEQKTLLGLAQEAGFRSKSTFNKAFKQLMGCSPSAYLRQQ